MDETTSRGYKQRRENIPGPSPGGTYYSDDWIKSQRLVKRLEETEEVERNPDTVVPQKPRMERNSRTREKSSMRYDVKHGTKMNPNKYSLNYTKWRSLVNITKAFSGLTVRVKSREESIEKKGRKSRNVKGN